MDKEEIEVKVKRIIEVQMGFKIGQVQDSDNFIEDLGADSLDMVELSMDVEGEFDIELPDEDFEKVKTVRDAIDLIASKQNVSGQGYRP